MKQLSFLLLTMTMLLLACQSPQEESTSNTSIVIRESTDAHTLHPISASDPFSAYITKQLFQPLIAIDLETKQVIGVVAESGPTITKDTSGSTLFSYSIRKGARFNQNQLLTAKDVLFSLKMNVAPGVNNLGGAYYFDFVKDFLMDENNPQKFIIVSDSSNVNNVFRSGDFSIMPQKIYDSSSLMDNYTLAQLKAMESPNDELTAFAEKFNEQIVSTKPQDYIGSGAYQLKSWEKGERIVLEKKDNWWGETLSNQNMFFRAKPINIRYEIIPEPSTAIAALNNNQVDFVSSIPVREFSKLDSTKFNLNSPFRAGFTYLGFNLNDSILSLLHVRQAIEAAIPYQRIVEIIYQNQSVVNRLPLAIQDEELRNEQLDIQTYDLNVTKELLSQNGWADTDKNGVLDKEINGTNRELKLNYHYNSGNDERKEIGLLIKAELKKVGIDLVINGVEWTEYLKMLRQNKFQLFINGTSTPPLIPDFTPSFHSKSANGGRNYANYQNKEADVLIDQIKEEFDENKRKELIYEFQSIVNRDKPYLMLFSKRTNIAISKKLSNAPIYSARPHFWISEFN